MTFEEFFLKKKIDLELLQANRPELFFEFKSHYEQMNEKSFDHSKKYWFNNLRQEFKLTDDKELALKEAFKPKDIIPPATITEDIKSIPEEPLNAEKDISITKPPAFKPRFKAGVKKPVENAETLPLEKEDKPLLQEDKPSSVKPSGFKPRFKAGINKPVEKTDKEETEQTQQPKEQTLEEDKPKTIKPAGFKPRFKAGVTKPVEQAEKVETESAKENILQEDEPKITKPAGFKPRFKAGQTQIKKEE